MNEAAVRIRGEYQNFREATAFSIFDIESRLEQLADEGKIWLLHGMKDLTEAESILINHYLNEKREFQIYDLV